MMKTAPIRRVDNLSNALSIGKTALSQLKSGEEIEYKREINGIHVQYPLELKDPIWQINEEALMNTLEYVFNTIHHQCYLVCVENETISMYRLSNDNIGKLYNNAINRAKSAVDKNPHLKQNQKEFIKKFHPTRIMQCIVKSRGAPEKDTNEYLDFLKTLKLPDGVFIFNLTDAVILRKDGRHPFPMVVGNIQVPKVKSYLPIFTMSGQHGYKDIPMPNYDELKWVYDPVEGPKKYEGFVTKWEDKSINKAVFRGGPTGCGYTPETNMRLNLFIMAQKMPDDLDVQLSGKDGTIDTKSVKFDPKYSIGMLNTGFPPADKFLTMAEQSNYKYMIHVDGNVNAYRMLYTMTTGSLLLRVMSDYTSWAEPYLKPNIHYIPIAKDLSNLQDKLRWCKTHDKECKRIAETGMKLARAILTPEFINNYFHMLFSKFTDRAVNHAMVGFKDYAEYKIRRKTLDFKLLPDQDPLYHPVKVAIIIPHRSRLDHLNQFVTHFSKFKLGDNSLDVYVIDQNNNEKFNRGLLLNIGFEIAKLKHYDRYIFHDVDTYPNLRMFENYFKFIQYNVHFESPELDNIKYTFPDFFGGVEAFTEQDFEKTNGFPNTFFGWGGEDDALYNRAVANQLTVYRPRKGMGGYNVPDHAKPTKDEKNARKQQAILDDLTTYKEDGLEQLSRLNITVSPMDDIRTFIKDYGVTKPDPVDEKILLRDMMEEDLQKGGANDIEYFAYKIDFKAKHEPNRDIIEPLPEKPDVPTLVLEPNKTEEPEELEEVIEIEEKVAPEVVRNDHIYTQSTMVVTVAVPFENVGRDMEKYFEEFARDTLEGRCQQDGYVRPMSTKIITYTAGRINKNIVYYQVLFMFDVFYPYEGMELECLIKYVNKIGIQANFGERINPAEIYVTREHNQGVDFDNMQTNKKIRIKVIGHRYELNDRFISILGELQETTIS
jgi:beta-1,4-galactosyltransferase 1